MDKEKSKIISEQTEQEFQIAWNNYWHQATTEKELKVWKEKMWMTVQLCCSNLAKSKLKGVKCPDFDGKILDATIICMTKILNGERPTKLSSFCYFPVIGVIWDRKLQKEERTISYEAWQACEYAKEERNAK